MKTSILDYPAINKGPGFAKRIFQGLIFLVSLIILFFLVRILFYYEVTGNQEQSDIPIIKAEPGLWIKPVDPGGKEAKHTGYLVNVLVHGDPFNEELTTIGYAPPPVELPEDILSLNSRGIPLQVKEESEEGDIMVAKTGKEILEDFFIQVEQGVPPMEIEAETLPPTEIERDNGNVALVFTGRELVPSDIHEGAIIAYIGTHPSYNLASNNWREILKKFPKDLAAKDWVIKKFTGSVAISYRLYAVGFDSESEADSFCARIEAGGHPACIRTLMDQ